MNRYLILICVLLCTSCTSQQNGARKPASETPMRVITSIEAGMPQAEQEKLFCHLEPTLTANKKLPTKTRKRFR